MFQSRILERESKHRISIGFLAHYSRPKRVGWVWVFPSANQSSRATRDGFGLLRASTEALVSILSCQRARRDGGLQLIYGCQYPRALRNSGGCGSCIQLSRDHYVASLGRFKAMLRCLIKFSSLNGLVKNPTAPASSARVRVL